MQGVRVQSLVRELGIALESLQGKRDLIYAGMDSGQEEKGTREDEMAVWHH